MRLAMEPDAAEPHTGGMTVSRRLAIIEADYRRTGGWYVERKGRRLAALTDRLSYDQFWDSYRLEPLADAPHEVARLFTDEFWDHFDRLVFRSRQFGEVAPHPLPSMRPGSVLRETGRLVMRGLYLHGPSYRWDRLLHWWRRHSLPKDAHAGKG